MKIKAIFLSLVVFSFLAVIYPGMGKVEAQKSFISADASTSCGVFHNIAGGVNFWGQREAAQRFIDEVGTDLYRIKVRLHEVRKVGDSYTNFPFSADDFNGELNIPYGAKPRVMIQIYGIPYWLSTSKDTRVFSNNLPNYAKYPPQDFEEWANVVSAAITKLREFGLEKIDYYEIFGEPNVGSTWYQQSMRGEPNELGHNTAEVMQNFYRIYEYTTSGIRAVDPGAKIGGVAVIPNLSGLWWTRFLCQEIRSRNMPLDFYSWHSYGTDERLAQFLNLPTLTKEMVGTYFEPIFKQRGFDPYQIANIIDDVCHYLMSFQKENERAIRYPYSFHSTLLKEVLIEEGFGEAELFLTEWNVSGSVDRRHDTHYGASFVTRGLIDLTDSYTEAQSFYCLSVKESKGTTTRIGTHALFIESTPKPSFNAFKAYAMLGDGNERISVLSSDEDIYSIATRDQDSISLIATYYVMKGNRTYLSSVNEVSVEIKNIPFEQYDYEIYLLDRNHSNYLFGSGPELELIGQGTASNDFEVSGNLGICTVVLIKITKIREQLTEKPI